MDTFLATIIVIFAVSVVIGYLKSTMRDRTLKDFNKFNVVVNFKNGRSIWGKMKLFANGFIITYPESYDNITHSETGYIVYKAEYETIYSIVTVIDDMDEKMKIRRNSLNLTFENGFLSKIRRRIRNIFAAVNDAIRDSYTLILGKMTAKSAVLSKNRQYADQLGNGVIDVMSNAYEPIFEYLTGKKVIYEVFKDNTWEEKSGIMGRYSKDFLKIINAKDFVNFSFCYKDISYSLNAYGIYTRRNGKYLKVKNNRNDNVYFCGKNNERPEILPNEEKEFEISEEKKCTVFFSFYTDTDIIFPRSIAFVRHTTD